MLGVNAAGDFKLKPMLIYHSSNLRTLKNYAKSTLPVLYKWNNKSWVTIHLFTTWFTEYFNPTVENYCSEKDSFQNITAQGQCTQSPKSSNGDVHKIHAVLMRVNTTSILQPMVQGEILIFKSFFKKYIS